MIFSLRKRSNVGIVGRCRWLVLGCLVVGMMVEGVWGSITLESVRGITGITREGRERVGWGEGGGGIGNGNGKGVEMRLGTRMGVDGKRRDGEGEGKGGQVIMGTGNAGGDRDEIENTRQRDRVIKEDTQLMIANLLFPQTVTAALHMLCSDLLVELEKPLLGSSSSPFSSQSLSFEDTKIKVKTEFDDLLRETTWFLYQVQERQMVWRWARGSAVQEGVVWLQRLWASRRSNSQDRSFIEQQLVLYKGTECFEKVNDEVLRKDIEVVEYLNDLIEMFP
ncbi:uncharacterized protein EAF01_002810 [Botrytis porri]|uniref:uncharacterized protein n=1 Tax=Botrytis porri TaxID=87229 RepID=UPI0019023DD8|nr:uncharacterized protein EAF01_002810 [Botrytis porri]KAF7911303.1 hypothetical protein EAF01_002810 [Botrytis porri]